MLELAPSRRAQAAAVDAPPAAPALPFRVGHGFDLHRLEPGYKLIIGGVDIPHYKGCIAHSDGAQAGAGNAEERRTVEKEA